MWFFGICYILPNWNVFRQLIFHYLQNVLAGLILETPNVEEWAQRIEVNDDEYSLFMVLRLGYCCVWCVEQNAWMLIQITRGQWGTFVQPGSISCCLIWVRYKVKASLRLQIFNGAKCSGVSVRNGANGKVEVCMSFLIIYVLHLGTIFTKVKTLRK